MDKPHWGLRVDGPLGRRFLRGLSLTRLWREGCCRAPLNYRRRPLMIKPSQPGFRPWENRPTSLRSRKCIPPLVAGATTFPPQFGGAAKGKRLNGQARRLTSPHLEVLCRTSTGDYKAPLCCELLMKRVFRGVLFCPPDGGKSGAAG